MKVVKLISTKSGNSLDEAILAKKNSSFQFEGKSGKLIDVNIKFSSGFPSGYTIASSMKTYPNKGKLIEALVPIMKSLGFNENVTSNDSEQIVTKDIGFSKSDEFDSIPDKTIEVKKDNTSSFYSIQRKWLNALPGSYASSIRKSSGYSKEELRNGVKSELQDKWLQSLSGSWGIEKTIIKESGYSTEELKEGMLSRVQEKWKNYVGGNLAKQIQKLSGFSLKELQTGVLEPFKKKVSIIDKVKSFFN